MTDRSIEIARLEQLDGISAFESSPEPIFIHGSVGHAAMMGIELPSPIKHGGEARDIDVFMARSDKLSTEAVIESAGLATPAPIDGGLSSLLVYDSDTPYVCKDGVEVELRDNGILGERTTYVVKDGEGVTITSFTPEAMFAVHSIEPRLLRAGHIREYKQLGSWFRENDVTLSAELTASIAEFQREYREKYPYGVILRQLADVYTAYVPEPVRKRLRHRTHTIMKKHAGRITPYAD
jgi:hypothetical protein